MLLLIFDQIASTRVNQGFRPAPSFLPSELSFLFISQVKWMLKAIRFTVHATEDVCV